MSGRLPDLTRVNGFVYGENDLVLDPKSPMPNARRLLADRYTIDGHQLLYKHGGVFHGWTGTHYVPLKEEYVTADIYHFLDYAKRPQENMLVRYEPNRARVGEVLSALGAISYLPDAFQSPSWIEPVPDLPATELISCQNGLLHFPTLDLLPHTPTFFTVNAIDYPYQANARPPTQWLDFLHQLWPDDPESIACLQEIFGYCLVADTSQQKAFMLIGPKRSGKGTIARILESVIGAYNCISPTLSSLSSHFGLAPLIGKRLAIISDARISGKMDTAVVAERLLAITGEDSTSAERKFLTTWEGKLNVRFLLISNELPRIADASGALPSRFIVLILTHSFFGKEDRSLTMRLMTERPGILNWAIAGYQRLIERGYFLQPVSANDAIRDLEDLGSPIRAFLRDRCEIAVGRSIACSLLFGEWKTWCENQNRGNAGTLQTFGRDLRSAVPGIKLKQQRQEVELSGDQSRIRFYDGIGLI